MYVRAIRYHHQQYWKCRKCCLCFTSRKAELEIGGQKIDKHFGHWLETWAQLTQKNELGVHPAYLNNQTTAALDQSARQRRYRFNSISENEFIWRM